MIIISERRKEVWYFSRTSQSYVFIYRFGLCPCAVNENRPFYGKLRLEIHFLRHAILFSDFVEKLFYAYISMFARENQNTLTDNFSQDKKKYCYDSQNYRGITDLLPLYLFLLETLDICKSLRRPVRGSPRGSPCSCHLFREGAW
jgi:hypothetical protein